MPDLTEITDLNIDAGNVYYTFVTDGSSMQPMAFPFNYWGSGSFTPSETVWDDLAYTIADGMVALGVNVIQIRKSYVQNADLGGFTAPNLPYPRP